MKKLQFSLIALIITLSITFSGCETFGDFGSSKEYLVTVKLETQVYKFKYFNASGFAVYSWETTSNVKYEVDIDKGDQADVDYPGTVTIEEDGENTFNIIFNEDGSTCNVKDLRVSCTIDGGTQYSSYKNNNCGRTRIIASIDKN